MRFRQLIYLQIKIAAVAEPRSPICLWQIKIIFDLFSHFSFLLFASRRRELHGIIKNDSRGNYTMLCKHTVNNN